ncbi:type II toxin-antitoxin system HipA family toxin [Cellulomonas phragmiteti]|uniref:Kinase Y4mE n=1 Tax=Cellulomonas phragmiteti TaxID=478780 RepID=A0ABQ4DMC0_9CELL|nr:HipA domain-containing protein [Cellulomonas phragmiteti]GIG40490.1 putative kinase Y4mE [Cellulomonas phragmiteti]
MNDRLVVWLHGVRLGEVQRLRNGRLRLRFDDDAVARHGIGARPLSLSLPVTDRRVQGPQLERFLDNLLPESSVRSALEREHGVRPGDTFTLLGALGRECAGAVQLTADDRPLGPGRLVPLTDDAVAVLVSRLPTLDPPDGETVSASLGGVQAKVLLTRTDDGWAWPADGAMSTHIVKPEPVTDVAVPDLVRWEEWTLRLARTAGLPAATAELAEFDGRTAIVVERFDRRGGARVHQEDMAQALGVAARDKYESSSARPSRLESLAAVAAAEATDPDALLTGLLAQVTFNLVVGNGDAHAKNYSLTLGDAAGCAMAPLYDVAPVYLLNPAYQHFGLALDGQPRLRHLTGAHLVREAAHWGMREPAVLEVVERVTTAVREALPHCAAVGLDTDDVAEQIAARAARVLADASV